MKTFWMSFCDNEGHNLGVCIVQGLNLKDAIRESWRRKINPGGEIMAIEIPPENMDETAGQYGMNRLIPTRELRAAGEKSLADLPDEIVEQIKDDPDAMMVDARCNRGAS